MSDDRQKKTEAFFDELAAVVDGESEAIERHADVLTDSDEARDARHEATRVAQLLREAGADFQPPEDVADKVIKALDARGPSQPAGDDDPEGDDERDVSDIGIGKPVPLAKASRRRALIPVAMAAAALLAVVAWRALSPGAPGQGPSLTPWSSDGLSARVARVLRASDDDTQAGFEVREPSGEFGPGAAEMVIAAGGALRTDGVTRVELELSDGSVMVLNHDTELVLDKGAARKVVIRRGELLAEMTRTADSDRALFETPTGEVEVLGTKFMLTADDALSTVRVTRGAVEIEAKAGQRRRVEAGQEGLLPQGAGARVVPVMDLASQLAWSEMGDGEQETEIRGLGELRAKRPGEHESRERPLALYEHKVRVRIAGNVARTEVEETFANDGPYTLEGIYRFPLPADARISSLELLVDGKWEIGAFVERDRAKKIWRGVIRNATPEQKRKREEEYIWVPGPWRDPALLEWQKGGRFELRIFPIPARGSRSVRLAYTQVIAPTAEGRRYVYPLPHSGDASVRVGRFHADVRISGVRPESVTPRGYELKKASNRSAAELTFEKEAFLPAGDMAIDYRLEGADSELRWWTFQGEATVAPSASSREGNPEAIARQRALHGDERPYVALALRPELPAWSTGKSRDYVFIVDASQSMVGERFERAGRLVRRMVEEMDRGDRFALLACDATCQKMGNELMSPSRETAEQVRRWLDAVTPAGASDLVFAVNEAARAVQGQMELERDVRLVYVGDGIATVGHRRAAALAREVGSVASDSRMSFTAVGLGGDADAMTLKAMARAGGGHYVPYVPGQRVGMAAIRVLETTYGVALQDIEIRFPEGVQMLAPAELPTIRAGEEVLITARLERDNIEGEVALSGKVAGEDFQRRYPVNFEVSTAAGNAFVPALWAAARIEDLQLSGKGESQADIIALSKAYGVMSRHTSLLVLESPAMFRAFGVDRAQAALTWTGEEEVDVQVLAKAESMNERAELAESAVVDALGSKAGGALADVLAGGAVVGDAASVMAQSRGVGVSGGNREPGVGKMASRKGSAVNERRMRGSARLRASASPAPSEVMGGDDRLTRVRPRRGGGRWMKKVTYRAADISRDGSPRAAEILAVQEAERALRENPDSRDRHRALARTLSRTGDLKRAAEVIGDWIERDRLDPEALTYLSDAVGRRGERDLALRLLSGVVDLRPDEPVLHERLARAFERSRDKSRACAHRIALSEIRSDHAETVARAVRCERELGRSHAADRLLAALASASVRSQAEQLAGQARKEEAVNGDLMATATWSGSSDIDLSLITNQGTRISWMGGRVNAVGDNASTVGRERLGLRRAQVGSYILEATRTIPGDEEPVHGSVELKVLKQRTSIPFTLTGTRAAIGRISVKRKTRLEPVSGPGPGPGPEPIPRPRLDSSVRLKGGRGLIAGPGYLDPAVVVRTIKTRIRAIDACYQRELRRNPTLEGEVEIRFTIAKRGNVIDVRVARDTVKDKSASTCVTQTVGRFRFNPGPEGGNATFAYGFVFERR